MATMQPFDPAAHLLARLPSDCYAWGYGRQSHREAIDANEGIPQQGVRTKAHYTCNLEPLGVKWGAFIPDNSAVSARTNPFMLRHAGRMLFDLMKPGDHFIIDKIDRLWRSMSDYVDVRRMFDQRKISLHICNMMGASVQLGTPAGDFLMNVFVAGAQMESDQCADRIRAHRKSRRKEGRYSGQRLMPMGTKLIGSKADKAKGTHDTRLLIWDPEYRKFMGEIVRLVDEDGKSARDLCRMIHGHFRQFMGDKFWNDRIVPHGWQGMTFSKIYWRERQYRALPYFNPNTIKFSIFDYPVDGWRPIGPSEPNTPNQYPFLDGRPIPTLEEFKQMAG